MTDRTAAKRGWLAVLRRTGARHGIVMGGSMTVAGALDYAVNVVAGRWLTPVDFGVFVSVTALLQVILTLTIAVRMVVAFYVAGLTARGAARDEVGAFLRAAGSWASRWGLAAAVLMAVGSPALARGLWLPSSWPLWAASAMVLALFVREAVYGAFQGLQAFTQLGLVQVIQAALRLGLAAALILLGARATGAIAAQPIGCALSLLVALWWLAPYLRHRRRATVPRVSWTYGVSTLAGLAAFGLLTNLDALFVKRYFGERIAGDYGTVVTFEKISLFLPWAVGLVLFPKVAGRVAARRDPRPLLLAALAAALAPGLAVTSVYFMFPGLLVRSTFSASYADPGAVLGMASLASTLYAGIHIWFNYALSSGRRAFIYAMVAVVAWQAVSMFLFGRESLLNMALAMTSAGILGNVAGFLTTWSPTPAERAAAGVAPPVAGS